MQASTNRLFSRLSHALIEPEYLPPDKLAILADWRLVLLLLVL